MTDFIGQFQGRVKFYAGILFIGSVLAEGAVTMRGLRVDMVTIALQVVYSVLMSLTEDFFIQKETFLIANNSALRIT